MGGHVNNKYRRRDNERQSAVEGRHSPNEDWEGDNKHKIFTIPYTSQQDAWRDISLDFAYALALVKLF